MDCPKQLTKTVSAAAHPPIKFDDSGDPKTGKDAAF
jgi:hypothetical protein